MGLYSTTLYKQDGPLCTHPCSFSRLVDLLIYSTVLKCDRLLQASSLLPLTMPTSQLDIPAWDPPKPTQQKGVYLTTAARCYAAACVTQAAHIDTRPPLLSYTDIDWAPLWTLDLSQITGDNFTEVPAQLVSEAAEALSRDGFIYAINHGLSWDQVLRQFAIGSHAFKGVPQEDKEKFKADILGNGSFAGYKQQGHWRLNGIKDTIEQYNVVSTSFAEERQAAAFPPSLLPFIPEIRAFAKVRNLFSHFS